MSMFLEFIKSTGFLDSLLMNQPTVHIGGVPGKGCDCGCWRWGHVIGDMGRMTDDRQQVTRDFFFWYRC